MSNLAFKIQNKLSFSFHLADHCNLKCKGCDNYSCIAPKNLANLSSYKSDLKRLYELFGDTVENIYLLGGEPMLNNKAILFCAETRKVFASPQTNIHLVTNGTLFDASDLLFWNTIKSNNVIVEYTPYPIKYSDNIEKIINEKYGINIRRFGHDTDRVKTLQFLPFDLTGKQNIDYNYRNCFHANKCIQLKNGVLYTCNIRAYIDLFIQKYNIDFDLSEKDGISIYDAESATEIMEYLSNPIPFCKYCDIKNRNDGHIWRTVDDTDSLYDWCMFEFDEKGKEHLRNFSRGCLITDDDHSYKDLYTEQLGLDFTIYTVEEFFDSFTSIIHSDVYLLAIRDLAILIKVENILVKSGKSAIWYVKQCDKPLEA